jgi:hypothetical protein
VICDTGDLTGTQSSLDTGDGVTLQRLWLCGRIIFDLGRDVMSVWLTEYRLSVALLEDATMDFEYGGATSKSVEPLLLLLLDLPHLMGIR